MTRNEINLSRNEDVGKHNGGDVPVKTKAVSGRRCQICTGCGRCSGVTREAPRDLRILTKDLLTDGRFSLENPDGLRLIAADVGTTTIAMELYRADGSVEDGYAIVNPQTEFGSDVLSRITAATEAEKSRQMTEMVKSALAQGAERFLKCLKEGETPVLVIAANTVMSYLLMGWDPEELGHAPFDATHLSGARFHLEVGKDDQRREIPCLLLPGFSAFVGGDLLAGAAACGMEDGEEQTLLIDLGTNGEILLGNREEILATATSAGPAFEGGPNRGIWGADLVKFVAKLLEENALDDDGLLAEQYFERGVRIGNVTLTKEAIRSIQLAKAAIQAGIKILAREKGLGLSEIDRVILAGGFGYFLNPSDAVRIGMLPASLEDKTFAGGNTALAGARKIGSTLMRRDFWEGDVPWKPKAENVSVINLAQRQEFEKFYLEAMAFSSWKE